MYKGEITSDNSDSLKTLFTPGYYYFLSRADSVSSELEYPPIVEYTYMYGILEVIVSDDLVLQRITSNNVVYFRFSTKREFIDNVVPWRKITPTTV